MIRFDRTQRLWLIALTGLAAFAASIPISNAADQPSEPVTTADPAIPVDELDLMLDPLTKEELEVEAQGWLTLLKAKVAEISQTQIAVKRQNRQINQVQEEAEKVREAAEEAKEVEAKQPLSATEPADAETSSATLPAAEIEKKAQQAEEEVKEEKDTKTQLLEDVTTLIEQRTALIDRFNTVLDALESKGGDPKPYRTYIAAVSGIKVDVTDTSALWHTITGWLKSSEGGLRWGKNILLFLLTLLAFLILAHIAGKAVEKALTFRRKLSDLLREFAITFTRRAIQLVGLMVAITMLEVNIGPLLAVVGAAGFIIAFALQGTLSNFASGLMILAYRPFDVGDAVNVAGTAGTVDSMNLVSTQIKTWDNQRVIVPNNSIWGDVITNITGLPIRRVDMTFGVSYGDDVDKARKILEEIVTSHEKVLDDPEPVVRLHELGDSSVNFICRPWTKTSDYWTVYWDVTHSVKRRFDAEGISIPFPQRDIHVYQESSTT